jgi:hypothetical protein
MDTPIKESTHGRKMEKARLNNTSIPVRTASEPVYRGSLSLKTLENLPLENRVYN